MKIYYCTKETFEKILNTCNGVFSNGNIDDEIFVDASRCKKELKEILHPTIFEKMRDGIFQVIIDDDY